MGLINMIGVNLFGKTDKIQHVCFGFKPDGGEKRAQDFLTGYLLDFQ